MKKEIINTVNFDNAQQCGGIIVTKNGNDILIKRLSNHIGTYTEQEVSIIDNGNMSDWDANDFEEALDQVLKDEPVYDGIIITRGFLVK
jgi:hypothetical protein